MRKGMGSAENTVKTAHWGIAFYGDKLYIFVVKALHIKKGVLIDEHR
jgi:hypothetical protein